MNTKILISLITCSLATQFDAHGGMWDPLPMTVHEWGVNTFDWDVDEKLDQQLPDFLYTDRKPGKSVAKPEQRVRDLPADSGIRTKPILYFYPTTKYAFETPPQVGVEMRFAYGYANAWWPQVNHYRDEKKSSAAKAPDWETWRNTVLKGYQKLVGDEAWEKEKATYEQLDPQAKVAYLANHMRWSGHSDFPEDARMQLVWDRLTLHADVPEGQTLPGANLPDDHWVKVAREVDAAYVSNGTETERFVFYEGKTREKPAIALLPERHHPFGVTNQSEGESRQIAVVNIGDHPIYDVIAVYRDSEKGILWSSYLPVLPAMGEVRHQVDQVMALQIPDFATPDPSIDIHLEAQEFERRTRERLIESLTTGYHYDPGGISMRDPADPQPPTHMHQLYKKEAVGLEKIWHEDFFQSEGLTVIYRESPAYLDEAMPLHVFTSMYWYVKLSRCGLVLNRNLPIENVFEVDGALRQFEYAEKDMNRADREKMTGILKSNRFLTLGMAKYRHQRSPVFGSFSTPNPEILKKLEALFE